jgi:hypothetical protein
MKLKTVRDNISSGLMIYSLSIFFTVVTYVLLSYFGRLVNKATIKSWKYTEISILIVSSLVFSPLIWKAHFLNLIIPLGVAACFALVSHKRRPLYAALLIYFILSLVGTDLTSLLPLIRGVNFISISIGAIFLVFVILYSQRQENKIASKPFANFSAE